MMIISKKMGLFSAMVVVLALSMDFHGKYCAAAAEGKVHHVVGDDRGWDRSSNVAAWASRKIFRVGDSIWFAYSAALENMVELRTRDEYESCDVSNPIRMYTDGLSEVPLDREGTRYFVSGNPDSCKNGLRLPVEVKPRSAGAAASGSMDMQQLPSSEEDALAAAPVSPPSASTRVAAGVVTGVLVLCTVALSLFL